MARTEFTPISWHRSKGLASWYSGSKRTGIGYAYANIHKVDPKCYPDDVRGGYIWRAVIMRYTGTEYREVSTEWNRTLREAKEIAEDLINREVCLVSLTGEILVDENYDATKANKNDELREATDWTPEPPNSKTSHQLTRIAFREDIRLIMRGGESTNRMSHDLIREITEWHDAGRPTAALWEIELKTASRATRA